MGHQLLYLHDAHKNYQKLSPPKQHPQRGHVHFSNLAASIPMCPMSLSFENGRCRACSCHGVQTSTIIPLYCLLHRCEWVKTYIKLPYNWGINIQTSYDLGYQVRFDSWLSIGAEFVFLCHFGNLVNYGQLALRNWRLPGWWLTHPSEKYAKVSWDDSSQYIYGKILISMFQTTNQLHVWEWIHQWLIRFIFIQLW